MERNGRAAGTTVSYLAPGRSPAPRGEIVAIDSSSMGRVEASTLKGGRARDKATTTRPSEAELRALLDEVLTEVDADDRAGSLLRAAGLRVRFQLPDLGMVLNI